MPDTSMAIHVPEILDRVPLIEQSSDSMSKSLIKKPIYFDILDITLGPGSTLETQIYHSDCKSSSFLEQTEPFKPQSLQYLPNRGHTFHFQMAWIQTVAKNSKKRPEKALRLSLIWLDMQVKPFSYSMTLYHRGLSSGETCSGIE